MFYLVHIYIHLFGQVFGLQKNNNVIFNPLPLHGNGLLKVSHSLCYQIMALCFHTSSTQQITGRSLVFRTYSFLDLKYSNHYIRVTRIPLVLQHYEIDIFFQIQSDVHVEHDFFWQFVENRHISLHRQQPLSYLCEKHQT